MPTGARHSTAEGWGSRGQTPPHRSSHYSATAAKLMQPVLPDLPKRRQDMEMFARHFPTLNSRCSPKSVFSPGKAKAARRLKHSHILKFRRIGKTSLALPTCANSHNYSHETLARDVISHSRSEGSTNSKGFHP